MEKTKKVETLADVKAFFNETTLHRSVRLWNFIREEAKTKFPKELISQLDASGYITEWLKG